MWKKVLLVFLALIVTLVIIIALQPSAYSVSRSTTIAAPPAVVFAQVNDFHAWEAWSPWAKLDPNSKVTFEGPSSGEGAAFGWSGNDDVGEGKMTITESKPAELIGIRLEFKKPMEGTSQARFTFKPDAGGTLVTWTMSGENNFIGKAFCMFMDMDKMVGGDFEKGLASMKAVAEGKSPATSPATAPTASR